MKRLAEEDRKTKALQKALYEAKQKGLSAEDAISNVEKAEDINSVAF